MMTLWIFKRVASLFIIITAVSSWAFGCQKVLISQTVDHPALNATTQGIIDALSQAGFKEGQNFELTTDSAQANAPLAAQIAQKFIHQNPDVVVGVGTLSAQSFAKAAVKGHVKLIFSSVTDPLGAGLIANPWPPHCFISGVSNYVDLTPQLELFVKLQPQLKKLGFLYNPGESNSSHVLHKLKELCQRMNIELIPQGVMKTADVPQGATKLAQLVGAIFISNDNTALSSLPSIIKIATQAKIPVYVSDTDAVAQGALAALGPNQYDIGLKTGEMIVRVLRGQDTCAQGVQFPEKTDLYLNETTASELEIYIPTDIKALARKIISQKR